MTLVSLFVIRLATVTQQPGSLISLRIRLRVSLEGELNILTGLLTDGNDLVLVTFLECTVIGSVGLGTGLEQELAASRGL